LTYLNDSRILETTILSKESEKHVLACLIKFNETIVDYLPVVKSEWFGSQGHSIIYQAIESLSENNKSVTRTSLAEYFANLGLSKIKGVDLSDYVESLFELYDLEKSKLP